MNFNQEYENQSPQECRRINRVLKIIFSIQNNPNRFSRKDLASKYNVSERTITKDIQIIKHGLCYPLYTDNSGYYFDQSFNLEKGY